MKQKFWIINKKFALALLFIAFWGGCIVWYRHAKKVAVVSAQAPFDNCGEAFLAGYTNIKSTSPLYQSRLDKGGVKGTACERR